MKHRDYGDGNFEGAPGSKHTVLTEGSGLVPTPTSGAGEKARGNRSSGSSAAGRAPTADGARGEQPARWTPQPVAWIRAPGCLLKSDQRRGRI